jgi:aryl-alcohol dehydrogenase-like predicted oxidoreductase
VLDAAFAAGVNHVDLADVYAGGEAERQAGAWLAGRRRDAVVVASKAFWPTGDGPNDRGLSRKHLLAAVEGSLRRLRTDHVDLFYCHREDPTTPLSETVATFADLIRAGKVRYWGTSCWAPATLARAVRIAADLRAPPPIVEQPRYSLVDRSVEREVADACRALGLGIAAWSPLAGGLLTGKYDDGVPAGSRAATSDWLPEAGEPALRAQLRAFTALARERGATPAALAIAWLVARPGLATAIVGAQDERQLADSLAGLQVPLDAALCARLDRLFPPRRPGPLVRAALRARRWLRGAGR